MIANEAQPIDIAAADVARFTAVQPTDQAAGPPLGSLEATRSADSARRYLQQRGLRRAAFGADVFREPAWDIMLDLYCSLREGVKVSIMDACVASGVPSTTGLRYLARLVETGLVIRRHDEDDARRTLVELSSTAAAQIEAWLHATWAPPRCAFCHGSP